MTIDIMCQTVAWQTGEDILGQHRAPDADGKPYHVKVRLISGELLLFRFLSYAERMIKIKITVQSFPFLEKCEKNCLRLSSIQYAMSVL